MRKQTQKMKKQRSLKPVVAAVMTALMVLPQVGWGAYNNKTVRVVAGSQDMIGYTEYYMGNSNNPVVSLNVINDSSNATAYGIYQSDDKTPYLDNLDMFYQPLIFNVSLKGRRNPSGSPKGGAVGFLRRDAFSYWYNPVVINLDASEYLGGGGHLIGMKHEAQGPTYFSGGSSLSINMIPPKNLTEDLDRFVGYEGRLVTSRETKRIDLFAHSGIYSLNNPAYGFASELNGIENDSDILIKAENGVQGFIAIERLYYNADIGVVSLDLGTSGESSRPTKVIGIENLQENHGRIDITFGSNSESIGIEQIHVNTGTININGNSLSSVGILNKQGKVAKNEGYINGSPGTVAVKNLGTWIEVAKNSDINGFGDTKQTWKKYKLWDETTQSWKEKPVERTVIGGFTNCTLPEGLISYSDFTQGVFIIDTSKINSGNAGHIPENYLDNFRKLLGTDRVYSSYRGAFVQDVANLNATGYADKLVDADLVNIEGNINLSNQNVYARMVIGGGSFKADFVNLLGDGEMISDNSISCYQFTLGDRSPKPGMTNGGYVKDIELVSLGSHSPIFSDAHIGRLYIATERGEPLNYMDEPTVYAPEPSAGLLDLCNYANTVIDSLVGESSRSLISNDGYLELHTVTDGSNFKIQNRGTLSLVGTDMRKLNLEQYDRDAVTHVDINALKASGFNIIKSSSAGATSSMVIIDAQGQEKTIQSSAFKANDAYTIKQLPPSFSLGSINKGQLIIDGGYIDEAGQAVLKNLVGGTSTVTVTEKGSISIDHAGVNRFIAEGYGGSILKNGVFNAGAELIVGANRPNGVTDSIGFKEVIVDKLGIESGKKLTLLGAVGGQYHYNALNLANGTLKLGEGTYTVDAADIVANHGGELITDKGTTLSIASLTGNGALKVNNKGKLSVGSDLTLTASDASTMIAEPAFRNEGTVNLQGLTVQEGVEYRNVRDAQTVAKSVVLDAGSSLTNLGTMNVTSLTGWGTIRNKGTLNVNGQLYMPAQTQQTMAGTVSTSSLKIGGEEQPSVQTLASGDFPSTSLTVQGQIYSDNVALNDALVTVQRGATLTSGLTRGEYFNALHGQQAEDLAGLGVSRTIGLSEQDRLVIGTSATDANLSLGSDSLTILSGDRLRGHAMFENTGAGNLSVSIDEGAQLTFDGKMLGRHYVASGFDAQSEAAFMEHQVKNMASGQMMGMSQDNRGVYIVNGSEHIADIAPDAHFKDAFDFVLQGHQDTQSDNAVIGWISQQLAQGTDKNTIGQATHDLAQTASMIGIAQQGLSQTMQVADQLLTEHSSDGHNLWATTLASDADFSGLDLGYGLSANYKAKNYGLMIGATGEVREGTTVGASMAYISGEVKGSGMKNDTETVAGSLYAKHRAGHWQTRAAVTLAQTDHDAKGSRSVKTDTKAAVLDLGAAYTHEVGNGVAVKPYAGVRVATLKMKGADMSVADKTLVHAQGKSDTFVQVPLGVQFEKTHESDTGWRVQAQANLGVIGTIGNTMSDARVNAIGFSAADTVSAQVLDRVTGQAGFGVTAQTPNGTDMSMSYRFSGSDSVKDHQLQLQVKYRF